MTDRDQLREALERLRKSAAMLQQHAEGCAINHYGDDFDANGMPGWLADTRADIDAAAAALATTPDQAVTTEREALEAVKGHFDGSRRDKDWLETERLVLAALASKPDQAVMDERDRIERRFWRIVDQNGLSGLPSDMWDALDRLVNRDARQRDEVVRSCDHAAQMRAAMHDAINSPKGVVPASAYPFYDARLADRLHRECPASHDGRHHLDTSMESGPNNCFHCDAPMPRRAQGEPK